MIEYASALRNLSALFKGIAAERWDQDAARGWHLRDTPRDAPFDIRSDGLADRIANSTSTSFMHVQGIGKRFEPDEEELAIFNDLVRVACAKNHYDAFRLLGYGQSGVVVEGVRDDKRQDVLRFGYQTDKDEWRLDFPMMTQASRGTFKHGGFLLEAMPPVLMLHQQGEEIEAILNNAFDKPGYARELIEKLLVGTPYMLTLFHDLALLPDGTIISVDPENAGLRPAPAMTPQQLRVKLMTNAADLNTRIGGYFPSFLELYTPDGRTKQDYFFPTEKPRNPGP